ncbi:cellobiose dehydrogenase [Penicillium atrosanguineum]|uniref:Cellobiose dehydrogenase n=1 Tax=Penicillium atrosanguineum TaxID=1132637 RepID=A0A9W9PNY1_9EURO|nr:cellobiose dehydrogenase [Penicillium atrosanguineum]
MRFFRAVAAVTAIGTVSASFQNNTYDYIIVGGGPSGIITAERIAEAGKKVLLLERGYGPTVSTGSNETLVWNNTLTGIDVPGLSGDIGSLPQWNQYVCTDTAGQAACVLGGGVTVNYMVFVHPPERDFNDKWPQGWKWNDVKSAASRLYERNPGSTLPSQDGELYDQALYSTLKAFFSNLGWTSVDMSEQPNEKYQVYSHPAWNIKDQKRAGPLRTYLPLAEQYDNFQLSMGTKVLRLMRTNGQITGVEVEFASGETEIITLPHHGRVLLSAGALSTPRVLWNSGIGRKAQLEVAQQSGINLPNEQEWIDLPVGEGLKDHPIFPFVVKTNGSFTIPDYPAIVNGSDTADISLYREGDGVLSQGKHRMIFFTANDVDGQTRYYQGSCAPSAENTVSITAYMTHGATSSGVLGLDVDGNTIFLKSPYLNTQGDQTAAQSFVQGLIDDVKTAGWELETYPNASSIIENYTQGVHWTSTAMIGIDDGRKLGGSSVVDLDTKVYGTNNLFIVDGSIHPDLPSGNIQATIMVVAEAAVARILAL